MNESITATTNHFTACARLSAIGAKLKQLDLFGPIRARLLGDLAAHNDAIAPQMLGILLAASLRAALDQALEGHADARQALESLLC